jgi:DNA invertase Pin-like site-specific DNA recombinase
VADRDVKFAMAGSTYDWADPFGKMFLQMLAVFAEFEPDLRLRSRTPPGRRARWEII